MVSVEDGSTSCGESHLGPVQRPSAFDLDEPVDERVFPYCMSGARTPPRVHGLGVGPGAT